MEQVVGLELGDLGRRGQAEKYCGQTACQPDNKMFCQRTLTRTDFNDDVTFVEIEAFHNLAKNIFISQKVLAK